MERERPTLTNYSHPMNPKPYNKDNPYSSFSGGTYKSSGSGGPYSTYSDSGGYGIVSTSAVVTVETCPTCNSTDITECECDIGDKTCSNGHTWFLDMENNQVSGNPHTDRSM
jgi:hypothetical protein